MITKDQVLEVNVLGDMVKIVIKMKTVEYEAYTAVSGRTPYLNNTVLF